VKSVLNQTNKGIKLQSHCKIKQFAWCLRNLIL